MSKGARIELKQVGARDHARLVGDAGHCGLELCCRSHLKELGGITMDMAKVQKHTADPSKITGRCGKLLCCLRYEYTTYTESRQVLPARGTRLKTTKGEGYYTLFEGGAIFSTTKTGTHVTWGSIRDEWVRAGAENGSYGFPTSDEYDYKDGKAQDFQGGKITWSPETKVRGPTCRGGPSFGGHGSPLSAISVMDPEGLTR